MLKLLIIININNWRYKMTKKYIYSKLNIGDLLYNQFIEPTNLSIRYIAKEVGVTPTALSEIIKGKRSITANSDLRLCKFFGLSDGYFLNIQQDYQILEAKKKLAKQLQKIKPLTQDVA